MINDKAASCMEALTAADIYGISYMLGAYGIGFVTCLIMIGVFYAAKEVLKNDGRYLDDND